MGFVQLKQRMRHAIRPLSSVCGCVGFVESVTGGAPVPNVIVADYCDLGAHHLDERALLELGRLQRDEHEQRVALRAAQQLMETLPIDEASIEALMASGYELARQMSWDVVARESVLPGIEAVCRRRRCIRVA